MGIASHHWFHRSNAGAKRAHAARLALGKCLAPAEVMRAGPPLPLHHWQVLRGTQRHTPQFTKPETPQAPPPEERAGAAVLSIAAGPPIPLHHWQTPGLTHLHTPQSTAPATPQEAMDRPPRSVRLVLLLANACVKLRASNRNLAMALGREGERVRGGHEMGKRANCSEPGGSQALASQLATAHRLSSKGHLPLPPKARIRGSTAVGLRAFFASGADEEAAAGAGAGRFFGSASLGSLAAFLGARARPKSPNAWTIVQTSQSVPRSESFMFEGSKSFALCPAPLSKGSLERFCED